MKECRFSAEDFLERVAQCAEAFGHQAGVGGMETAGGVVAFLAENPDWLGAFMKGGILALPGDWHARGRLTWHARDGKVVSPEYARRARVIRQLERGELGL